MPSWCTQGQLTLPYLSHTVKISEKSKQVFPCCRSRPNAVYETASRYTFPSISLSLKVSFYLINSVLLRYLASLFHPSENIFPLRRDRPIAMPQITATEPPHKIPVPNNGFQATIQEKKVAQNPSHFTRSDQFTSEITSSLMELSDTETPSLL